MNVKSDNYSLLLLELEFTGDAYNSNPDWNNFKISSYISWSFFIHYKILFMAKKKMSLEVVNPNAAGIDIGSRSHWVSIGQNSEDVREYGVYSEDYQELCKWLKNIKLPQLQWKVQVLIGRTYFPHW